MVNIIHIGFGVDQLNEVFYNLDNVLTCQHSLLHIGIKSQLLVKSVTTYFTKVIALV